MGDEMGDEMNDDSEYEVRYTKSVWMAHDYVTRALVDYGVEGDNCQECHGMHSLTYKKYGMTFRVYVEISFAPGMYVDPLVIDGQAEDVVGDYVKPRLVFQTVFAQEGRTDGVFVTWGVYVDDWEKMVDREVWRSYVDAKMVDAREQLDQEMIRQAKKSKAGMN